MSCYPVLRQRKIVPLINVFQSGKAPSTQAEVRVLVPSNRLHCCVIFTGDLNRAFSGPGVIPTFGAGSYYYVMPEVLVREENDGQFGGSGRNLVNSQPTATGSDPDAIVCGAFNGTDAAGIAIPTKVQFDDVTNGYIRASLPPFEISNTAIRSWRFSLFATVGAVWPTIDGTQHFVAAVTWQPTADSQMSRAEFTSLLPFMDARVLLPAGDLST